MSSNNRFSSLGFEENSVSKTRAGSKPVRVFVWENHCARIHDFLLLYRELAIAERNEQASAYLDKLIEIKPSFNEQVRAMQQEISRGSDVPVLGDSRGTQTNKQR